MTSDIPQLRDHFWRTVTRGTVLSVALVTATFVPLAAGAALAGSTFAGAPTDELVTIIALLLAGLPAAFVIAAGARLLASTRTTYLLPWFAVCSLGFNTLFDILGAHWWGVEGIALSSTLYRCVTASLLLFVIHRLMKTHFRRTVPSRRYHPANMTARWTPSLRWIGQVALVASTALALGVSLSLAAYGGKLPLFLGGLCSIAAVVALFLIPIRLLPGITLIVTLLVPTEVTFLPHELQGAVIGIVPFAVWLFRARVLPPRARASAFSHRSSASG